MAARPARPSSPWEVLFLHMRVLQAVMTEAEPALARLDLDVKGFFVLSLLDEHPHPAELARALCIPRPTVTLLVKRLEAAGYLKRQSVAGDLRKFRLTPTADGRKVAEKARGVLNDLFGARLGRLSAAQAADLCTILGRLIA